MWIKICGLRTTEAIDAAVEAGADAIGFVFAPSKRQVDASFALKLTRSLSKSITRVAVMQHPEQALVDEVCSIFKPDVLQSDHEDFLKLKLPATLATLPVFRAGKAMPTSLPPRILFEGPISGTGEVGDWTRAAELARQTQLILAGGLNPENVAQAIATVKPVGVDVSSGVESSPGLKDLEKIAQFVSAVRQVQRRHPLSQPSVTAPGVTLPPASLQSSPARGEG